MITHGAEKIINSSEESVSFIYLLRHFVHHIYRLLINEDIDAIIARGEERTITVMAWRGMTAHQEEQQDDALYRILPYATHRLL